MVVHVQDVQANPIGDPLLLCLSANPELRETRRRVLLTKYRVVTVSTLSALRALPTATAFHLLILCHSLPFEACEEASTYARSRWPGIKILSISAPYAGCLRGNADAVVGGLAGPYAMLDAVADLLRKCPHGQDQRPPQA